MTDLFEEVEEQLRSDRYKQFARKALPWMLGVAAAALIAVLAGLTFRRSLMDALPEPVLVRHNQTICFSKEACR